MGELPSRYSSRGLSAAEQKRVITTGTPRPNRPMGAIKIEERVHDALSHQPSGRHNHIKEDTEGDIPMVGMDDEEEVQIITEFVTDKRRTDPNLFMKTPNLNYEEDFSDIPVKPHLKKETYMVLDTNFMMSHLDIVDQLSKLHTNFHHKLVIPLTVVKELDGLKESQKHTGDSIDGVTVGHLARWANDWSYHKLADMESSVRGQKMREKLDRQTIKDDSILDCALYLKERENALVILLSNDKNLCMKALTHEVPTVSYRKGMTAALIAQMAFEENRSSSPPQHEDAPYPQLNNQEERGIVESPTVDIMEEDTMIDDVYESPMVEEPDVVHAVPSRPVIQYDPLPFQEASSLIFSEVQKIVLGAIDYCMYAEYEEDLELIGYHKSKVLSLRDASAILIKYWVSVFTEYFGRSSFKPFDGRGRKSAVHVGMPRDQEELNEFVEYWGNVLQALYLKRGDEQNSALVKILERWEGISKSCYD